jgi:hypothetical protein
MLKSKAAGFSSSRFRILKESANYFFAAFFAFFFFFMAAMVVFLLMSVAVGRWSTERRPLP